MNFFFQAKCDSTLPSNLGRVLFVVHRESCVPEGCDDPRVPGAVSSACPGGGGRSPLPSGEWSDAGGGPVLVASVDGVGGSTLRSYVPGFRHFTQLTFLAPVTL